MLVAIPTSTQTRFKEKKNGLRTQGLSLYTGPSAGYQQTLREYGPPVMGKHGIRQVGFWTDIIGNSNQKLTYMLEWNSLTEREQKWNAFTTDPEWLAAKAETEKNGQIIARIENSILAPTVYSKMK